MFLELLKMLKRSAVQNLLEDMCEAFPKSVRKPSSWSLGSSKRKRKSKIAEESRRKSKRLSIEKLPPEMAYSILSYLDIGSLENLAHTSKAYSEIVLEFLLSSEFANILKKERSKIFDLETSLCRLDRLIEHAIALGDLFRVSMVSLDIEEKVAILYHVMQKPKWILEVDSHLLQEELYLKFYGRFAERFVRHWSPAMLKKAHCVVESISGIEAIVSEVLDSNSTDQKCDERSIRDYYQYIYFHYSDMKHHGLFMALILQNYPVEKQAKLMYIIWGIVNEGGNIDWEAPLQPLSGYLHSSASTYAMMDISNMGRIINLLHRGNHFSGQHIMELIRKIISIPDKWNPVQIAQFVLRCGDDVLALFIAEFVFTRQRFELCIFSLQCAYALMVNGCSLDGFIKLFLELFEDEFMGDLKKFIGALPTFAAHLAHMSQIYPLIGSDIEWQKVCTQLCSGLRSSLNLYSEHYELCYCNEM